MERFQDAIFRKEPQPKHHKYDTFSQNIATWSVRLNLWPALVWFQWKAQIVHMHDIFVKDIAPDNDEKLHVCEGGCKENCLC